MRLEQILDETLELLEAYEEGYSFKTYGDLQKSRYQHSKPEEDRQIRSDMYKNTVGNPEAAKKGWKKRKANVEKNKETTKKAAKKRADWYKNPTNKEKFMRAIKKRLNEAKKN